MAQVSISNKWLYFLPLKQHLTKDESPDYILKLARIFADETAKLSKKVARTSLLTEYYAATMSDKLDEVSGEFDFLSRLIDGTIDKNDWADYSFEGDFLKEFNNALAWLYDVGDEVVYGQNNRPYKFLFLT